MYFTCAIDRAHGFHALPGLTTVCPGVHRQRAADRARDAGEELGRTEPPANALPGKLRAGNAAAGTHEVGIDTLQLPEDTGCGDDHTAQTAVPDEQVAADTQPENGRVCIEFTQEGLQVLDARGHEQEIGLAARTPRDMPAHRLVAPQLAPRMHCFRRRHHECTFRSGLLPSSCGSFAA